MLNNSDTKPNMFPSLEFINAQSKILEGFKEELACFHLLRWPITVYLYTGYVKFQLDYPIKEALNLLVKKINKVVSTKKDYEDLLPFLVNRLCLLENLLEPLDHDIIVYKGISNDIIGLDLHENFVKSDKLIFFHPLAGSKTIPLKTFVNYNIKENPRDYIIRNPDFTSGIFTNFTEAAYQSYEKRYDTIITLKLPKGVKFFVTKDDEMVLFPNVNIVLYDNLTTKLSKSEALEINIDPKLSIKVYVGAICPELQDYNSDIKRINRLFIDENFNYGEYGRNYDEQRDRARSFMYHQEKSYEQNVLYAFPQIDIRTKIPQKFYGKTIGEINALLQEAIISGKNKHWTNQQLSYMRKELFSQAIFNKITEYVNKPINIVDATGNIGGDSLLFALQPKVNSVITYEINPNTFKLLQNNIDLYGLTEITAINENFSPNSEKIFRGVKKPNTVVIIDPPYEYPPGADRFVYSIDKMPLIYIINDCLKAGAELVVITVPLDFTFNEEFAINHNLSIDCFLMGKKDMKIYITRKNKPGQSSKFYSGYIKMPAPKI